jgi:uncharacterized OsmC-like protein
MERDSDLDVRPRNIQADPPWVVTVTPGPIVSEIAELPELEGLAPLTRKKARPGEPYRPAITVVAEPTSLYIKRGFVDHPVPGGSCYELYCEGGKPTGGGDTAPSPLAYFVAGAAFCLLTHITGFLSFTSLNVRKLKVEMRGNFMTGMGHINPGEQGEGGCDGFETYVIVESDEPADRIKEFIEMCEKACVASQSLAKAIPTSVSLVLNGNRI